MGPFEGATIATSPPGRRTRAISAPVIQKNGLCSKVCPEITTSKLFVGISVQWNGSAGTISTLGPDSRSRPVYSDVDASKRSRYDRPPSSERDPNVQDSEHSRVTNEVLVSERSHLLEGGFMHESRVPPRAVAPFDQHTCSLYARLVACKDSPRVTVRAFSAIRRACSGHKMEVEEAGWKPWSSSSGSATSSSVGEVSIVKKCDLFKVDMVSATFRTMRPPVRRVFGITLRADVAA